MVEFDVGGSGAYFVWVLFEHFVYNFPAGFVMRACSYFSTCLLFNIPALNFSLLRCMHFTSIRDARTNLISINFPAYITTLHSVILTINNYARCVYKLIPMRFINFIRWTIV